MSCSYLSLLPSRVGRVQALQVLSQYLWNSWGLALAHYPCHRLFTFTLIPATCWSGCEDVTPDKSRLFFPVLWGGYCPQECQLAQAPSTLHVRPTCTIQLLHTFCFSFLSLSVVPRSRGLIQGEVMTGIRSPKVMWV